MEKEFMIGRVMTIKDYKFMRIDTRRAAAYLKSRGYKYYGKCFGRVRIEFIKEYPAANVCPWCVSSEEEAEKMNNDLLFDDEELTDVYVCAKKWYTYATIWSFSKDEVSQSDRDFIESMYPHNLIRYLGGTMNKEEYKRKEKATKEMYSYLKSNGFADFAYKYDKHFETLLDNHHYCRYSSCVISDALPCETQEYIKERFPEARIDFMSKHDFDYYYKPMISQNADMVI